MERRRGEKEVEGRKGGGGAGWTQKTKGSLFPLCELRVEVGQGRGGLVKGAKG